MRIRLLLAAGLVAGLVACGGAPPTPLAVATVIEVHKSPTCDCCGAYEAYLEAEGFEVRQVVRDDVADLKAELGVPDGYASCHTSLVGGYFVEGHVPAEVIIELLEEAPAIDGITLPGMPPGSPGMPGVKDEAWTIFGVSAGEPTAYTSY